LPEAAYPPLLDAGFKTLFKRFTDPSEACRASALRLTTAFFAVVMDLTPYLAYFVPVSDRQGL
jgi:hypothetical protein